IAPWVRAAVVLLWLRDGQPGFFCWWRRRHRIGTQCKRSVCLGWRSCGPHVAPRATRRCPSRPRCGLRVHPPTHPDRRPRSFRRSPWLWASAPLSNFEGRAHFEMESVLPRQAPSVDAAARTYEPESTALSTPSFRDLFDTQLAYVWASLRRLGVAER